MMKEEPSSKPIMIRKVWGYNLFYEFSLIRQLVGKYNFVSMDTEFPGIVHSPTIRRRLQPKEQYGYLKANVDALNIIQIGLTLSDAIGNLPHDENNRYIWEFNFRDFNVKRDLHNKDSIEMLYRQGIDFFRNTVQGVDSIHFAMLMRWSGLLFNDSVTWVTFHSAYDFGYLVKILTRQYLPYSLEEFLHVLRRLFGSNVYDIKYMIRYSNSLYGGLEQVADILHVDRAIGKSHQAGSDSLLTSDTFHKMVNTCFVNNEVKKHAGVIFGLEVTA